MAKSHDLVDVLDQDVVFDPYSHTGFRDVEQVQPWVKGHKDLLVRDIHDYDRAIPDLKLCLKASIQTGWDPNDRHLLTVSGGKDSRIIVQFLMEMAKDYGKDWLGDYLIVSHEELAYGTNPVNSSVLFKAAMKELNVPEENYMVYNGMGIGKEDYFGFDYRHPPNAYDIQGTDMMDVIEDPKDWTLVMGTMGGEMTAYPAYKPRLHDRWQDLLKYFPLLPGTFARVHHTFKGFFQPYLFRPYVDTVFRFDDKLFRGDEIRDRLMGKTRVPFFFGHSYNLAISEERMKKIEYLYKNSRFYDRFAEDFKEVRDAEPWNWFYDRKRLDGKLFGLAMTYEEGTV